MSRINTNVSSLIAQRVLHKNQDQLNASLERLSTGLKINKGADDPAGLIASENLRAEKTGITTAIDNAQRAGNIIGTAEGGLSEVSSLLNQLQGLVGAAANSGGLSSDEIAANQLQVDSILSTINRIAGATSFQGQKLLDGHLAYTTSSVTATDVNAIQINAALLPANAATNIVIGVTQSAQTATLGYAGGALGANNAVTLEISGSSGTQQVSVAGGATVANIIAAVNGVKASTGVSAAASGANLRLDSQIYGSKQFVTLKTISGTFVPTAGTANGRDAKVNVNGAAAQADGLAVSFRNAALDLSFNIGTTINTSAGATNFYITGGGARFSLGSKVTETDKASIGIASVSTGSLGDSNVGFLSSLQSGQGNALSVANLVGAQKVVDAAIKQVSNLRGRLGAFQKFTIGSTVNSLGVAFENASAAESAIRDTDFAAETSALTRAQILSQAATTVLTQANSSPQSALTLLRGA
jgi:flagellin